LNLDGSEDYNFIWPKQPDLILVEDIPNKKEANSDQKIDFFFKEKLVKMMNMIKKKKIHYLIMIDITLVILEKKF